MTEDNERLRCWASGEEARRTLEDAYTALEDVLRANIDGNAAVKEYRSNNYAARIREMDNLVEDAIRCGETPIELSWIGRYRKYRPGLVAAQTSGEYPQADLLSQIAEVADVLTWMAKDAGVLPRPASGGNR